MRSIYAKPLRIATTIFGNLLRAVSGAKPNNRMQLTAVRAAREIVALMSAVADPKR